ncbi:hypothetical protein LBMAG46_25430 [Planctomycetia bacterium]|nr:hypothetical protein LBMAG46_25430 [Planctomycetia bacterium]
MQSCENPVAIVGEQRYVAADPFEINMSLSGQLCQPGIRVVLVKLFDGGLDGPESTGIHGHCLPAR